MDLQECENSLNLMAAKLERHMQDLVDRFVTKTKTAMTSDEDLTGLIRLQAAWETVRLCKDICSKVDSYLKVNIGVIENYATGDAVQPTVSTDGKTIHGINRGLGGRARQVGGHLHYELVQQLSRGVTNISILDTRSEGIRRSDSPSVPPDGVEKGPISDFQKLHGRGLKLTSKSFPDVLRSAESG